MPFCNLGCCGPGRPALRSLATLLPGVAILLMSAATGPCKQGVLRGDEQAGLLPCAPPIFKFRARDNHPAVGWVLDDDFGVGEADRNHPMGVLGADDFPDVLNGEAIQPELRRAIVDWPGNEKNDWPAILQVIL